jgi:hypothetical protein
LRGTPYGCAFFRNFRAKKYRKLGKALVNRPGQREFDSAKNAAADGAFSRLIAIKFWVRAGSSPAAPSRASQNPVSGSTLNLEKL